MSRPAGLPPLPPPESTVGVLDIGGTHVTSAQVDPSRWTLIQQPVRLTVAPDGSATAILARFGQAANAISSADNPPRPLIWGVAMPDPFDYATGTAWFQGVAKFERLYGLDVRAALLSAIDPTPLDVVFINDADAFILGEWLHGAATGAARCVGITLGTGVGSGFLADGAIVDTGPDVPAGGRAHTVVVDGVPLEELMSRRAIRRSYAAAGGDSSLDVREICARARDQDRFALVAIRSALGRLGTALAPWIARFGADVLVIGGSMAASWDVLEPPFLDAFAAIAEPPPIAVAVDADRAPLLGAAQRAQRIGA